MFEHRGGDIPVLPLPSRRYGGSVTRFVRSGLRLAALDTRSQEIRRAKSEASSWRAYRVERRAIHRQYAAADNPVYARWLLGESALHAQTDQRDITVARLGDATVRLTMETNAEFTASHLLLWVPARDDGSGDYRLSRLVIDNHEYPVDETGPAGDVGYLFDFFNTDDRMRIGVMPLAHVVQLSLPLDYGKARAA